MALRAGFSEIDITPPLGISKIGWIRNIVSDTLLDPLYARIAVIENDDTAIAFVQLDTLRVDPADVQTIRSRAEAEFGIPGTHIMVTATHNHAGPAVADAGEVKRDEAYTASMLEKVLAAFSEAHANRTDAEIGIGSCFEFNVAHNRRVVMRDGTTRTHGNFDDPGALYVEGPIDPEVAVLAARDRDGQLLGGWVNFACHPTHHGGGTALSAGYPGVLAQAMKEKGCPVTLFLNGASGNLHTANPTEGGRDLPMEEAGRRLAEDAWGVIANMTFRDTMQLGARSRTLGLPFRDPTEDQVKGTVHGAQRFVDPNLYDKMMPVLLERIEKLKTQPAEVQVLFLDEYAVAGIPAEYFVQHGLRIKEQAHPKQALVVGYANGNVGYVPHREAFQRGGYETTFTASSCLAPEAGDLLADCALELIRA